MKLHPHDAKRQRSTGAAPRWQRRSAVLAIAGLLGAAPLARPSAAGAAANARLDITARDFAFDGVPSKLPAGLTTITLRNTGTSPHDLQLLRVEGSHTDAEVRDVLLDQSGAPIPAWVHAAGGLGTVRPGATASVTVNLTPGAYVYASTENGETKDYDAKKGMLGRFTVAGAASAEPTTARGAASITAVDRRFENAGLKAGRNAVVFRNRGKELPHFVAFKLLPGKSVADLAAVFDPTKTPSGPPPADFDSAQNVAVLDGGKAAIVMLDLTKGSWVFACFITDRAGGAPHVNKGMLTQVDVA